MKSKLTGWIVGALFVVVVVAIAIRTPFIKNFLTPTAKAAA